METGYVHEALPLQVTAEVTDIILNRWRIKALEPLRYSGSRNVAVMLLSGE